MFENPHRQPQCTLQFVFEDGVFCSSELILTFLYVGSSMQNASQQFVSCVHHYFVNFDPHPTPQTKM
jgi:hypothetical protein